METSTKAKTTPKSAKALMVRTRNICSDPDMAFSHEVTLETDHGGEAIAMIWIKSRDGGAILESFTFG